MAKKSKNQSWKGNDFQQVEMSSMGANAPIEPQIEVPLGSGNVEPNTTDATNVTNVTSNNTVPVSEDDRSEDYIQAIYDYARENIYKVSATQQISSYFTKRIHNLIYNDAGYWGDNLFQIEERSRIVLLTLQNLHGQIQEALERNREQFTKNDAHRVNYLMKMITSNLSSTIDAEMIDNAKYDNIAYLIKVGALFSPNRENKVIDPEIQEQIEKIHPQKEIPDEFLGDPLAEKMHSVKINSPKGLSLEERNKKYNEYWE